jgi:hypothetical protein
MKSRLSRRGSGVDEESMQGDLRTTDWIESLLCAFFACAILALPLDASAQAYRWQDENGQVHLTDDPSDVPPRFRKQIETLELPEPTRPAAPPAEVSWLEMLFGPSSDPAPSAVPRSGGTFHEAMDEAVRVQWPDLPASKHDQIVALIVDRLPFLLLALAVQTVATLALFGHAVACRRPFWALGNLLVLFVPPFYALLKLETSAPRKVLVLVAWATGPAAGFRLQFAIAQILV